MIDDPLFMTFLAATILLVIFAFFIVYFAIRNRNSLVAHDEERKLFLLSLQNAKIEESERAMEQMSKYIHDNIGQIAHLLRMNLHAIETFMLKEDEFKIVLNASELADRMVNASRSISHSLNSEMIRKLGLETNIRNEIRFAEASRKLDCPLKISGYPEFLSPENELLVFRIFQEALQNTIKHAGATTFSIWINYEPESFLLCIKDDGKGFNTDALILSNGLGYMNMQQRAKTLNAKLNFNSSLNQGCIVTLRIKKEINNPLI